MSSTILFVGALFAQSALAQSAGTIVTVEANPNRVDVGYAELVANQPLEAIARIKANTQLERDDPAALINLGTASARLGRINDAKSYFRAAIVSQNRFDLELADGSWLDSRRAARKANALLETGAVLALR